MDGPFLVQKFMKFWTMRLVGTKNGELLDYCNRTTTFHRILRMEVVVHNQPLANCEYMKKTSKTCCFPA